jgi:hypothetical protein
VRAAGRSSLPSAIGFLADPSATYITGAVLDAHGGYNA